jgi:hypothetical protein
MVSLTFQGQLLLIILISGGAIAIQRLLLTGQLFCNADRIQKNSLVFISVSEQINL